MKPTTLALIALIAPSCSFRDQARDVGDRLVSAVGVRLTPEELQLYLRYPALFRRPEPVTITSK